MRVREQVDWLRLIMSNIFSHRPQQAGWICMCMDKWLYVWKCMCVEVYESGRWKFMGVWKDGCVEARVCERETEGVGARMCVFCSFVRVLRDPISSIWSYNMWSSESSPVQSTSMPKFDIGVVGIGFGIIALSTQAMTLHVFWIEAKFQYNPPPLSLMHYWKNHARRFLVDDLVFVGSTERSIKQNS